MEKSAAYQHRQELLETLQTPSIGDAKKELSGPLATIVLEQCHPALREDFGLEPPLVGPGDELWISPSDLLIGKVLLKPPLTQKHVQALTHQGILEIGYDIEIKFRNEMRLEKEKALRTQEDYLLRICEGQKTLLISRIRAEVREIYENKIKIINRYFEKQIAEILVAMVKEILRTEHELQCKHQAHVVRLKELEKRHIESIIKFLTTEFLMRLGDQEALLTSIFKTQIDELEARSKCEIEFERKNALEALKFTKHKLHCQNVANLMYILCRERHNCQRDKTQIETNYKKQIRQNKYTIKLKNQLIEKLKKIRNHKIKQIDVREKCLIEIIRQFRQLIYLAIQAVPHQAEYLLSIQKLMKFEVDNYCADEQKKLNEFPENEIEELLQKPLADEAIEETKEIESILSKKSSVRSEAIVESDVLPAMYFNDDMYVREDFRNMFSQGIEIRSDHPLWNRDVEELMKILKQSIHEFNKKERKTSLDESQDAIAEVEEILKPPSIIYKPFPITDTKCVQTDTSLISIPVNKSKNYDTISNEKELNAIVMSSQNSLGRIDKPQPKRDSRSTCKLDQKDQSRLTLARDSIIIRISSCERKSVMQSIQSKDSSTSKIAEAEQGASHISSAENSKLLAACDSIDIIRSQTRLGVVEAKPVQVEEIPLPPISQFAVEPTTEAKHELLPKAKDSVTHLPPKEHAIPDDIIYVEDIQEFNKRVHRIINTAKKHPSLIRLFTS